MCAIGSTGLHYLELSLQLKVIEHYKWSLYFHLCYYIIIIRQLITVCKSANTSEYGVILKIFRM